ncbi:MAG: ribosome biogenesis GTPase Der [Epsilonproteobacteria bacterium]|nr:MAG: ribosome biogenesis GTPase Der [Campylobacterota bacterium]
MIKIALIGQPNVGKSSLFNRLARKRVAIVSDVSGTTRDVRRREIDIFGREAMMLDTGGISKSKNEIMEDGSEFKIFTNVKRKAIETAKEADIVLYMVDGKNIPDDEDKALFYELQNLGKKLALVVNKIDNDKELERLWDFFEFGINEEDMFGISVSHNRGTKKLFEWLYEQLPPSKAEIEEEAKKNLTPQELELLVDPIEEIEDEEPEDPNHIKVAIIGKPNVGKSSILNALIGEERSVVSPIAGTTIDPVDETYQVGDKKITFIDTAGLRRRGKIQGIEKFALMRTEDMLAQANIALIVLDASEPLSDQDEKISGLVDQFGLGTIIVLNKWDENLETFEKLSEEIRGRFKFLYYATIVAVSAKTGRNIEKLEGKLLSIFENYHRRIPTSELNNTIEMAVRRHSLPSPNGNRLRIYFATQFDANPPTIAIIMNKPRILHFSYKRYLINFIRDNHNFEGVPVRVVARGRGERSAEQEQFEATYQAFNLPTDFVLSKFEEEDGDFEYHN